MGKKSKRNRSSAGSKSKQTSHNHSTANNNNVIGVTDDDDRPRVPPALRTAEVETIDNLRFEDPFIDEFEVDDDDDEDDEDWEDYDQYEDDDIQEDEDKGTQRKVQKRPPLQQQQQQQLALKSWNPLTGETLQAGEQLEMDVSAYKMHHALTLEWPALSFDVLRDDWGEARTRFPHTLTMVVGTQAATPTSNSLTVIQLSDLGKIRVETEDDILGEEYDKEPSDDSDDSDDDMDNDDELDPVMSHYSIPHCGGVNRVRAMPQYPDIVATWSDVGGMVHLYNVHAIQQRFAAAATAASADQQQRSHTTQYDDIPTQPFFSHANATATEGFAMDWSPVAAGYLVTGDCQGSIRLWSPRSDSSGSYAVSSFWQYPNTTSSSSSLNNAASIEDLQWSPTEATVFGSAEGGGTVRIFDTRAPGKAMLCHRLHNNGADVNVLSWNRLVPNLLATGGDDGTLAVWDLRHFAQSSSSSSSLTSRVTPLARFTPHTTPITSVEWHPTDESMLAASDNVGAYIYDLSVEADDNDNTSTTTTTNSNDVPPQLLFVHCGSEQFKEVHWHPQITSCLMTTALTGFSVFIPSNL